jgi:hypothetical protein
VAKAEGSSSKKARPPATTPEGRENQLISLAYDLAEKQLRNGSASSQVTTHFLQLGSSRERIKQELDEETIALKRATRENMASVERIEKLYVRAISSMRRYQGQPDDDDSVDGLPDVD